jgi:alkylation response protein AidB-like acyl-CoA dehydrogenase
VTIGGAVATRESGPIGDLMKLWRSLPDDRRADPVARDQVAGLWTEAEVLRLTNLRATQNRKKGIAGPEGSVSKLAFAEVNKRIYECAVNLMGADGLLIDHYDFVRPQAAQLTGGGDPRKMFLRSRANSIEGGTSEILRNIMGERVLGLPGEPRTDKALAWKDVPRN